MDSVLRDVTLPSLDSFFDWAISIGFKRGQQKGTPVLATVLRWTQPCFLSSLILFFETGLDLMHKIRLIFPRFRAPVP